MKQKSRWEKCHMKCPEENIETDLILEWHEKDGKKVLNSVNCGNSKLMDLKPVDCQWSCWEVIEKKEGKA